MENEANNINITRNVNGISTKGYKERTYIEGTIVSKGIRQSN